VDLTIINYNNLVDPYIIILNSLDDKYKEFVYRTITTLVKKTNLDFKILAA